MTDSYLYCRPFDPKTHGELEDYLARGWNDNVDNLFHGPEYFHKFKEMGLLQPFATA